MISMGASFTCCVLDYISLQDNVDLEVKTEYIDTLDYDHEDSKVKLEITFKQEQEESQGMNIMDRETDGENNSEKARKVHYDNKTSAKDCSNSDDSIGTQHAGKKSVKCDLCEHNTGDKSNLSRHKSSAKSRFGLLCQFEKIENCQT